MFKEVTFIFNSTNYWGGYVNEKTIERQKSGENGIFRVFYSIPRVTCLLKSQDNDFNTLTLSFDKFPT